MTVPESVLLLEWRLCRGSSGVEHAAENAVSAVQICPPAPIFKRNRPSSEGRFVV